MARFDKNLIRKVYFLNIESDFLEARFLQLKMVRLNL
jgi:hypothetical protein